MKILKLDNNSKKNLLEDLLKRSPNNYGQYAGVVDEVLNNVKNNGDKALFEYTKKFDKATITSENIRVTQEEIEEAYTLVDENLVRVIRKALVNIKEYHEKLSEEWFPLAKNIA